MQTEQSKNDVIDQTSALIFFVALPLTFFGAFDGALNIIFQGLYSFNWLEELFFSLWDTAALFGLVEEISLSEALRNSSLLGWGVISLVFSLLLSAYCSVVLYAIFGSGNSGLSTEEELKGSQGKKNNAHKRLT